MSVAWIWLRGAALERRATRHVNERYYIHCAANPCVYIYAGVRSASTLLWHGVIFSPPRGYSWATLFRRTITFFIRVGSGFVRWMTFIVGSDRLRCRELSEQCVSKEYNDVEKISLESNLKNSF